MKISTQTRYAMRFLAELALYEGSGGAGRLTTQEIAKRQRISEKYLEAIANKLKKGGLVTSAKGVNGGYRLAVPSEDIKVGEVMRLMETHYFQVHCVNNPKLYCPNYGKCALACYWESFESSLSALADTTSLSDLSARMTAGTEL